MRLLTMRPSRLQYALIITIREMRAQDASGFVVLRRLVAINMHCVRLEVYKRDKALDAKLDWKGRRCDTAFFNEHSKPRATGT